MLREEGIPFANPWRRKRGDWNPLSSGRRGRATHWKLLGFYHLLTGQHPATFTDVHEILSLLRVEDTLKRGVKSFYKQMSSEVGKSNVAMSDVENAFDPEAWKELNASIKADETGQRFCTWVSDHCSGQRAGPLHYASGVVAKYGFEGLSKPPRVFVGTCHSFKGAQADHVILYPDLSQAADRAYSPMASDDERDGVVRTYYVGMTRAKKSLTLCAPRSRLSVDIPLDFT
jgi:hypothetical protein